MNSNVERRASVAVGVAISCLAVGLVVYWLLGADIALFDWLSIERRGATSAAGSLRTFARNYLADGLWCIACLVTALFLKRRAAPRAYFRTLLALPFCSELAQALQLLPGTFDWGDVAVYSAVSIGFLWRENRNMKKTMRTHLLGCAATGVLSLALIASSSPPSRPAPPPPVYETGTFTMTPRADEVFAKSSLAKVLAGDKALAVVLRVPASDEKVTGEQRQANNLLYNTIEKELAKAGYLVRDRALFSKVLDQGQLDYSRIGQLTETDLILELVRYEADNYGATEYKDEAGTTKIAGRTITFVGAAIEFKVVSVKENDLVASYTFRYAPCINGCTHKFSETVATSWAFSAGVPANEAIFKEFASRLVRQLKPRR